jgi:hypothetical protein
MVVRGGSLQSEFGLPPCVPRFVDLDNLWSTEILPFGHCSLTGIGCDSAYENRRYHRKEFLLYSSDRL